MTWVLYADVAIGLALASGVLVMSLLAGRRPPIHTALWAVGLSLLVLRAVFSVAIALGVLVASEASWAFAIGAVALVTTIPIAVLQPRWAGITLLVSAVLQPTVLFVLGRVAGVPQEGFPVEVMLVFYSLTVAVIGGLLIASTLGRPSQPEVVGVAPEQSAERVSGS